ncbi:MAG: hypothetical protein MI749_11815, partial [Desulfovibrionales bacterium]|nr:hypothetical protein [Desulfovibrionales bacterium]
MDSSLVSIIAPDDRPDSGIVIIGPDYSPSLPSNEANQKSREAVLKFQIFYRRLMAGKLVQYGIRDPETLQKIQKISIDFTAHKEAAAFHPDTVGRLGRDYFPVPMGMDDIKIPPNVGGVVVLLPRFDPSPSLYFYRHADALIHLKSTVPVILMGADFHPGESTHGLVRFLSCFFLGNECRAGRYAPSDFRAVEEFIWDLQVELGVANLDLARSLSGGDNVYHIQRPDRMGFEIKTPVGLLSDDGMGFREWVKFGCTQGMELGYPVISLEKDNASQGGGFIKIALAPLTTSEYMAPELNSALAILKEVVEQAGKGEWTVRDLIKGYNGRLEEKMGSDGARYVLNAVDRDLNRRTRVVKGKIPSEKPGFSHHRTRVLVAYADVGTETFINSMGQGGGSEPARLAAEHVEPVIKDMGEDPSKVRLEFSSFIFLEIIDIPSFPNRHPFMQFIFIGGSFD